MRNLFITFSIVLFSAISSFAQTEAFTPGWYMVKSGAQVQVIQGNSDDELYEVDWTQISYSANEVLLVFDFTKDKYYCFDPQGRVVMVKGKTSLEKIETIGRAVPIIKGVKISNDLRLGIGNNVWLVELNAATKTATILLADGQKVEIPQSCIQDLKEYYDIIDQYTEWYTVE